MDTKALIEIARDLLCKDPKHKKRAEAFSKVSLRKGTIVVLESERKKARYEAIFDSETGEFIQSCYTTDGL